MKLGIFAKTFSWPTIKELFQFLLGDRFRSMKDFGAIASSGF